MRTTGKTSVTITLIASLVLGLGGCCGENRSNGCNGLQLHPIYSSAFAGALIGGIVGYQSDEPGEGAAVGAAILGVGALLHEIDRDHRDKEREDECTKEVVVEIHNDNGSVTPVRLKRKDCAYIGPKGERYEELPTEEQLRPIYGLK